MIRVVRVMPKKAMKKGKRICVFAIVLVLFAAAAAASGCTAKSKITQLSQLEKKTFAVPVGTVADELVLSRFPHAVFLYYGNITDACLAVISGEADAAAYDEPILRNIAAKHTELTVLNEMITVDDYGFAVRLGEDDLKKAVDDTIAEIKEDGTYDKMLARWLPKEGLPAAMPAISPSTSSDVLRFGTAPITEPFSFLNDKQEIVGFDIELAEYIAKKLDKKLEVVNMEFGELIPSLIAGKVDMVGACITITEERSQMALFSKPYYTGGIAAIVNK